MRRCSIVSLDWIAIHYVPQGRGFYQTFLKLTFEENTNSTTGPGFQIDYSYDLLVCLTVAERFRRRREGHRDPMSKNSTTHLGNVQRLAHLNARRRPQICNESRRSRVDIVCPQRIALICGFASFHSYMKLFSLADLNDLLSE